MPESLILGVSETSNSADSVFPLAFFGVYLLIWLVFMAVIVAAYAIGIWAIVDAARRPDYQYTATGQSKTMWIILPAVGLVTCQPVALVAGLIFLLSTRKKLNAVPAPPPGWFGYGPTPQPGWYGQGAPAPPGWYGTYPPPAPGFSPPATPGPWAGAPAAGWAAAPHPEGTAPVRQGDFAPPSPPPANQPWSPPPQPAPANHPVLTEAPAPERSQPQADPPQRAVQDDPAPWAGTPAEGTPAELAEPDPQEPDSDQPPFRDPSNPA